MDGLAGKVRVQWFGACTWHVDKGSRREDRTAYDGNGKYRTESCKDDESRHCARCTKRAAGISVLACGCGLAHL